MAYDDEDYGGSPCSGNPDDDVSQKSLSDSMKKKIEDLIPENLRMKY